MRALGLCSAAGALATLAGCNSNAKVVLVKAFNQGDTLALANTPPEKARYNGTGSITSAASYTCG